MRAILQETGSEATEILQNMDDSSASSDSASTQVAQDPLDRLAQDLPPLQGLSWAAGLLALSALGFRALQRRADRVCTGMLVPSRHVDAVVLGSTFLALVVFSSGVAALLHRFATDPGLELQLLATAGIALATTGVLFAALVLRGGRIRDLGFHTDDLRGLRLVLPTYAVLIPAYFGANLLEILLRRALDLPLEGQAAVQGLLEDPSLLRNGLILLIVVVAIPLYEELVFRGVLFPLLLRITGRPILAMLVAAGLFAAAHDAGKAPVFVLGLGMAWLYLRTRILWPSILLHCLHNGVILLLLELAARSEAGG